MTTPGTGPPYCDRCGGSTAADDWPEQRDPAHLAHLACRRVRRFEPPRYCTICRRRLIVQVLPDGWRARCSAHGQVGSPNLRNPSATDSDSDSTAPADPSAFTDPLAFDRAHVWHPYAPAIGPDALGGAPTVRLVERAEGVRLHLAGHGPVIDGMSSWWAAVHGYRHPVLDAVATRQLQRMSHVMFGGLTHQPALDLVARLLEAVGVRYASRLPVRLRIGVGRGRREDVPAVPAQPR